MAASSRLMVTEAERRFPVRIRLAIPDGGLGLRLAEMHAWLNQNCGADGWAMTPTGQLGALTAAVSIYFGDPTLAGAFVARWCAGGRTETAGGVFRVREDEPIPRVRVGRRDGLSQNWDMRVTLYGRGALPSVTGCADTTVAQVG